MTLHEWALFIDSHYRNEFRKRLCMVWNVKLIRLAGSIVRFKTYNRCHITTKLLTTIFGTSNSTVTNGVEMAVSTL